MNCNGNHEGTALKATFISTAYPASQGKVEKMSCACPENPVSGIDFSPNGAFFTIGA
jgi:hypothetical protein